MRMCNDDLCDQVKADMRERIDALEAVMHYVAVMLIGCEDEDEYLRKMVLAVLEEKENE